VLPYADGAFTLVVSRFLLHHVTDPDAVVREMARVCAPGGRVAIVDITAPEDPKIAERYNAIERLRDPTHTAALSSSALASRVAGADWRFSAPRRAM
jgi:ubiquinone/menaquinone biosynthesis C-methylase UbiE